MGERESYGRYPLYFDAAGFCEYTVPVVGIPRSISPPESDPFVEVGSVLKWSQFLFWIGFAIIVAIVVVYLCLT